MSYDLKLFRVPEGVDAEMAVQELMAQEERECADIDAWKRRPVPESTRANMRRVADALKALRPTLEEFQPKSPLPWIELTDESLLVQFGIFDRMVSITVPYFGERAQEMMDCAAGSFAILKSAGYIAWDPQL